MTDHALISRIARVDPEHAEAMRANPTTFEATELPFWRQFRLVRAVVSLVAHPMQLRYADNGKVLIEIPLTLGAVGVILLPVWTAIGAIAALAANLTIVVEKVETTPPPENPAS